MASVRISLPLVMGEAVTEKLAGRGIYEDHLEEMLQESPHRSHFRHAREGGLQVYGRDRGGRYLLLILYPSEDYRGQHVVATCRDMNDSERKLYTSHIGR